MDVLAARNMNSKHVAADAFPVGQRETCHVRHDLRLDRVTASLAYQPFHLVQPVKRNSDDIARRAVADSKHQGAPALVRECGDLVRYVTLLGTARLPVGKPNLLALQLGFLAED